MDEREDADLERRAKERAHERTAELERTRGAERRDLETRDLETREAESPSIAAARSKEPRRGSSDDRRTSRSVASWARRHRRALGITLGIAAAVVGTHIAIAITTRIQPPAVTPPALGPVVERGGIRRVDRAYTRFRAGIREVYLEGSPERIGASHTKLLYGPMLGIEDGMWGDFARFVPIPPARVLLWDIGRVRYRHVDQAIPEARRRELAMESAGLDPDPYSGLLPTYHRMTFMHSLYDIALSFEHSPLIGCSAFVLGVDATKDEHTLLGRAFDFEAGEQYDRDKAVFFVKGDGTIPFASVAWPGLVGVLSGMNAEGVALVVNGARAREPRVTGEPVVFTLREVLERAHDTREAVAILKSQEVMVSHLVMVADAKGEVAIVERAPGAEAFVRDHFADPARVPLTNHFEGPLAADPRNEKVRSVTTTVPRRARLDEMLAGVGPHEADVERAVSILRDHTCAGGDACPIGDRRSIDALIATHGIVADTTARVLWVSASPHLSGHFVRFDLGEIFAPNHDPSTDHEPQTIAEDPILHDGRYAAGRARAGGPKIGGDAK